MDVDSQHAQTREQADALGGEFRHAGITDPCTAGAGRGDRLSRVAGSVRIDSIKQSWIRPSRALEYDLLSVGGPGQCPFEQGIVGQLNQIRSVRVPDTDFESITP